MHWIGKSQAFGSKNVPLAAEQQRGQDRVSLTILSIWPVCLLHLRTFPEPWALRAPDEYPTFFVFLFVHFFAVSFYFREKSKGAVLVSCFVFSCRCFVLIFFSLQIFAALTGATRTCAATHFLFFLLLFLQAWWASSRSVQ